MARLDADEEFDHNVVNELRRLGHDVLTVQQAGKADQAVTDQQVLSEAASDRRAVVTFNRRHFIALHNSGLSHSGIIVCTRDPDSIALASRMDAAIQAVSSLGNHLLRVARPSQHSPQSP